ncbi:MAG: DUF3987 domain-containing protein [Pseudomonadota bacterium]
MTSDLSGDGRAVVEALLGSPNKALSSAGELRYGTRGSLSVDLRKATWFDHEANEGGGMIELVRRVRSCGAKDAADWLEAHGVSIGDGAQTTSGPRIVATYDYRDERGELIFQVVRRDPKDFRQRRPDRRGDWIWSLKGVRRVLYRLPELLAADPAAPVFIVEGEKDADRLAALGLVATTNAGGAGKWRAEYGDALRGRRVVVVPDNDDAGSAHANRIMRSLQTNATAAVVLTLPELPPKGDVSDWLDAGGDADRLTALAERALSSSSLEGPARAIEEATKASAPTPLLRPRRKAEEIPRAALGPLRAVVEAIEAQTQAPGALAMQSVLGAASLAAQAHADVETLGPEAPVSLFLFSVAQSGERKSTCDRIALAPVRRIERERIRDRQAQLARYEDKAAIYEAERRSILKGDNVARDADLEALGPPPTPPLMQTILMGDPTIEGVLRGFAEGQPSIGVFSDEGGQFVGGHAMNRENRLKTAAAFSKLWDGAEINRTRGAAEAQTFFGRRATLHVMVQPIVAEALFGDETLRDQGLLARMLIAAPESRIGARTIEIGPDLSPSSRLSPRQEEALAAYYARISALLERTPATEEGMPQELKPRCLPLAPEARALLIDFFNETERAQAEGGALAGIRGAASKASEQAARIAGVLTLYEDADAVQIEADTMVCAIALATWYLGEAQRLLDAGGITPETMAAEALRRWLVETSRADQIDVRTIVRHGPNALRDTARVRKLIPILERNGWLVREDSGELNSRRRERWRIVRG